MKILIIGSKLNLLSGSARPLFELMSALRGKKIETSILSDSLSGNSIFFYNRNSQKLSEIENSLKYKLNLVDPAVMRYDGNILSDLIIGKSKIKELIHSMAEDYDLLLCTDFMLAWLLKKNRLDITIPVIYIASNNLDLSLKYLMNAGKLSFTNLIIPDYAARLLIPRNINKFFLNQFDCIISTSKFVANILREYRLTKPIYDLPIGVQSPDNYRPIEDKIDRYFLYFGWGSSIRGLPDVIDAFKLYKLSHGQGILNLRLQGLHGFEERHIIEKLKNDGIRDVEINYFSNNIEKDIDLSSLVILPFRIPFGYSQPPLVVLESMAAGRCVISTNIGSIPEYVVNNYTGFLINPGNTKEIAKLMLELESEEINRVGYNAFRYIKREYNWDVVSDKYIKLIKLILDDSPSKIAHP